MNVKNKLYYLLSISLILNTTQLYAKGFTYTGNEAHIKSLTKQSLTFDDIEEILNKKINNNILDLDNIFNKTNKSLPSFESNQSIHIDNKNNTNIGNINSSNIGDLIKSTNIQFEKGTGYPMINGKVDFGVRIDTGNGLNSKFSNVQYPFDMNRIKSMNRSININPSRGVKKGHNGMDFNTRVSNLIAEDGSASNNNPNKVEWNNQGVYKQTGASINYYAIADGIVTATYQGVTGRPRAGTGYWLRYTIEPGDGEKYTVVIMHMQEDARKFGLEVGSKVEKGQYLGRMGSTGDSSNTHLHLELLNSKGKPVDPMYLFTPNNVISKEDGQKGSIKLNTNLFKSWALQNGFTLR